MEILCHFIGFLGGAGGKYLICQCGRCKRALGREDPLEEDTGTHSSVLAWRIAWPEQPGRLGTPQGLKSQT